MAYDFEQTDGTSGCAGGGYCSSQSAGGTTGRRDASNGGTTGSSEVSLTANANSTTEWLFNYALTVGAEVSWDGGDWSIPINHSSGNMNVTLEEVWVCRLNSGCTNQESLGNETGIGFATNGGTTTRTFTCSGASPSAGDVVQIICVYSNSFSMDVGIGITPDQTIQSPFTAGGSPAKKSFFNPFGLLLPTAIALGSNRLFMPRKQLVLPKQQNLLLAGA